MSRSSPRLFHSDAHFTEGCSAILGICTHLQSRHSGSSLASSIFCVCRGSTAQYLLPFFCQCPDVMACRYLVSYSPSLYEESWGFCEKQCYFLTPKQSMGSVLTLVVFFRALEVASTLCLLLKTPKATFKNSFSRVCLRTYYLLLKHFINVWWKTS